MLLRLGLGLVDPDLFGQVEDLWCGPGGGAEPFRMRGAGCGESVEACGVDLVVAAVVDVGGGVQADSGV
ncbi:hypothetical protein D0Q02_23530, partial [Micromonospora craniellae]